MKELLTNNNQWIIFAVKGNSLLVYGLKVPWKDSYIINQDINKFKQL